MRAKTGGNALEPAEIVLQIFSREVEEREWNQYFSDQEWQELRHLTLNQPFDLEQQTNYWSQLLLSWDARSLKPMRPVYDEVRAILDIYLDYLAQHFQRERSSLNQLMLSLSETQVNLQQKQLIFWRFEYEQKQFRVASLRGDNEQSQAEFYNLSELTQFVGENLKDKEQLIKDALDGLMGVLDASWTALFIYDDANAKQGTFYTLRHEEFHVYHESTFPHSDFWDLFWKASINESYLHDVFEPVPELELLFPGARSLITQTMKLSDDRLGLLISCSDEIRAFSGFRQLYNIFGTHMVSSLQNAHLHAQLNKLAITDALTGVFNRRHLEERLHHSFDLSRRYNRELSVLMVDIDHFKKVNDIYGHQQGDKVLISVVDALRKRLRSTDIIGRYGGEEFTVILQETGATGALSLANDLVAMMSDHKILLNDGQEVCVTISVGYASFPEHTLSLEPLVKYADEGLYLAKGNGRNQVGFAGPSQSMIQ